MKLFVSCPRFTEDLLRQELTEMQVPVEKEVPGGVYVPFETINVYKICYYSRIANRVLLQLKQVRATDPKIMTQDVKAFEWEEHFSDKTSFIVDCHETTDVFRNSKFASQIVKDGIVDRFAEMDLNRPKVDPKNAQIHVHLFFFSDKGLVSIDLSGGSLHERNYRVEAGKAPLKENTAAAFLKRAGWRKGVSKPLLDPMCGSGTLLIEAAGIAADLPAAYFKKKFGFEHWKGHNVFEFRSVVQDGEEKYRKNLKLIPKIIGMDIDKHAVYNARDNIKSAGLSKYINVFSGDARNLEDISNNFDGNQGLIAFNPPYGERLGNTEQLAADYTLIGTQMKRFLSGWTCSIITSSRHLASCIGMKAYKKNKLYNGGLLTYLYHYEIICAEDRIPETDAGMEMFKNRLIKNKRLLKKWLTKNNVTSYRLYDADMPEYSAAIDIYENKWIHLQEYAAPKTIDPRNSRKRLGHILSVLPEFTNISAENMFYQQRQKQSDSNQYNKQNENEFRVKMNENGLQFYIDLKRSLDTGIFLDLRLIRKYIGELAQGKVFLNLFAYTGTASVYAAANGAKATYTVDPSKTYLNWCADNFTLNNLNWDNHFRIQKDCLQFLNETKEKFDLIFIDPPAFSNSKSRTDIFSIQDDYIELLNRAIKVTNRGGKIIFSNNFKRFNFENDKINCSSITEITDKTLSQDFNKSKYKHRCWELNI